MTDEETFAFIQGSIKSVWALELLLVLKRSRDRSWHGEELVRELRSSQVVVTEALNNLRTAGLVSDEPGGTFKYRAASSNLDGLVEAVDKIYQAKPMAVINAIMTAPSQKLRIFSDAFKLRDS